MGKPKRRKNDTAKTTNRRRWMLVAALWVGMLVLAMVVGKYKDDHDISQCTGPYNTPECHKDLEKLHNLPED